MPTTVIAGPTAANAPVTFTVPPSYPVTPLTVSAEFNGTGSSGSFMPCLSFYSQDGRLLGRYGTENTIATGGSGEVTFAPFLGRGSSSSSGGVPILGLTDFNPVAGFVQITSTNPAAPTTVVTGSAITFDGVTTVKIEFWAAGVDMDQRGKTALAGVLLELYDNTTALGVSEPVNAQAGEYDITTPYISTFYTPSAGSHTFSVTGYIQAGAGTIGNSFVYGTNVATPHATRPGYLALYAVTT